MQQRFEEINSLIAGGKEAQAVRLLDGWNPAEEERAEHLYLRGLLDERAGNWENAVDKYAEARAADPDHMEATFRAAYLLDLHGYDDEAIELYGECTKEAPAHVNAVINLAVLLEDHGRYEEAVDVLEPVVDQYPNHQRAWLFLEDVRSSLTMHYDENQERVLEERTALLDTPISEFELSVRSRNCLKQMGIATLGELLKYTEQDLLAYKNFGETSLNECKEMLRQKGLLLGQALADPPTAPAGSALAESVDSPVSPLAKRSVNELQLSVRSRKCLQRLGIQSIEELTQRSEVELLSTKNFGHTSLNEIKRQLAETGLSLRGST